jgi:hypothetical protein
MGRQWLYRPWLRLDGSMRHGGPCPPAPTADWTRCAASGPSPASLVDAGWRAPRIPASRLTTRIGCTPATGGGPERALIEIPHPAEGVGETITGAADPRTAYQSAAARTADRTPLFGPCCVLAGSMPGSHCLACMSVATDRRDILWTAEQCLRLAALAAREPPASNTQNWHRGFDHRAWRHRSGNIGAAAPISFSLRSHWTRAYSLKVRPSEVPCTQPCSAKRV